MDICNQSQLNIARWSLPNLEVKVLQRLIRRLIGMWRVRRERHYLSTMDERMLKDIGLTRLNANGQNYLYAHRN